jgi:hypothetical protein
MVLGLVLAIGLVQGDPAQAWGRTGHKLVGQVAAELTEEGNLFWGANVESIESFSNTPDTSWKSGPSASDEKPTHWFHLDHYSPEGGMLPVFFKIYDEVVKRYGEETVTDNGSATWRVQQFYLDALKHLRSSRYEEAVQLAGAMSHYIGDLAQPLHVTVNYDGQLTGQKGIHKFFETDNLEDVSYNELHGEVTRRAQVLLNDASFRASFEEDLLHAMFMASSRSLKDLPTVLRIDKQGGRSGRSADQLREIAVDRMADGAASYALILSRLWRDGGQDDDAQEWSPREPKWVAPDYSQNMDDVLSRADRLRRESRDAKLTRVAHNIAGQPAFVDCQ